MATARRSNTGYSLIETVVTLGILGIVAYLSMTKWKSHQESQNQAQRLEAADALNKELIDGIKKAFLRRAKNVPLPPAAGPITGTFTLRLMPSVGDCFDLHLQTRTSTGALAYTTFETTCASALGLDSGTLMSLSGCASGTPRPVAMTRHWDDASATTNPPDTRREFPHELPLAATALKGAKSKGVVGTRLCFKPTPDWASIDGLSVDIESVVQDMTGGLVTRSRTLDLPLSYIRLKQDQTADSLGYVLIENGTSEVVE
jgi:type II secretory pathway pseudopilin PulG